MASRWRSTFLSTFSYRPYLSVDSEGDEIWGALVEDVPCRYQPSNRLVREQGTGAQVVEEAILFTEAAITSKDLVWLPGTTPPADADDTTGSRRPLLVHERRELFSASVDHYEVHL